MVYGLDDILSDCTVRSPDFGFEDAVGVCLFYAEGFVSVWIKCADDACNQCTYGYDADEQQGADEDFWRQPERFAGFFCHFRLHSVG